MSEPPPPFPLPLDERPLSSSEASLDEAETAEEATAAKKRRRSGSWTSIRRRRRRRRRRYLPLDPALPPGCVHVLRERDGGARGLTRSGPERPTDRSERRRRSFVGVTSPTHLSSLSLLVRPQSNDAAPPSRCLWLLRPGHASLPSLHSPPPQHPPVLPPRAALFDIWSTNSSVLRPTPGEASVT